MTVWQHSAGLLLIAASNIITKFSWYFWPHMSNYLWVNSFMQLFILTNIKGDWKFTKKKKKTVAPSLNKL